MGRKLGRDVAETLVDALGVLGDSNFIPRFREMRASKGSSVSMMG